MTIAAIQLEDRPKRVPWLAIVVVLAVLALLAVLGLAVSLELAAIFYAVGFMALTWFRKDLAFLLILMMAPFVWDLGLGPVKMAISDVSLMLAFPVLVAKRLLSGNGVRGGSPLKWPIAAYLFVCIVSIVANGGAARSFSSMLQMVVYLVVAVYVFSSCVDSPAQMMLGLHGLLLTNLALAILLFATGSNYVLGLHKNATGGQMAYAVIIGAELWLARAAEGRSKLWFTCLLGGLVLGLVLTLSRGAWMGAAAGVMIILLLRGKFRLVVRSLVVLVPVIAAAWALLPAESKEYAVDFSPDARNIAARFQSVEHAMRFFRSSPILGVGVGLRKTYDATNVVMSTLAETGVVGLTAFLGVFVVFFLMVWAARRRTPLSSATFSMLAIGAALVAGKFLHGCVDHFWSRGILPVWVGMGLAVYAYKVSRAGRHGGAANLRAGGSTR